MPMRVRHDGPAALLRRIAAIDDTIARAAAQGEQRAFDRVYDALFPLVWRMSAQRARGSKRDAERLTARILEEIVRSLDAPSPDAALKTRLAEELRIGERRAKRGSVHAPQSRR